MTTAKAKPFTCRGCGAKKVPDGTPKNAPFIWTDVRTKTRSPYCHDCDDKLLAGVELPKEKRTASRRAEG